jgi:hypothetical protein
LNVIDLEPEAAFAAATGFGIDEFAPAARSTMERARER